MIIVWCVVRLEIPGLAFVLPVSSADCVQISMAVYNATSYVQKG
jgi:hypothetical protein